MAQKNQVLEEMLDHGPVYVDNCRMDEVVASDLTEVQRANVVVTPEVREEYMNSNQGRENPEILDNFSETNVHKLVHQTKDLKNYGVANRLFKSIVMDNLITDFSNEAYEKARKVAEKNVNSHLKANIKDTLLKVGFTCLGALGVVYLDRLDGDNKVSRFYNRIHNDVNPSDKKRRDSFQKSRSQLVESLSFDAIAGKSNKKSRRHLKKQDIRKVGEQFFDEAGNYTPDKTRVYNDADIAVQAIFDSVVNDRDVTIYTADKEFVGNYVNSLRKVFGDVREGNKLKIHYTNGTKTQTEEVTIPKDLAFMKDNLADYVSKSTENVEDSVRSNINMVDRYARVRPGRTLFNSVSRGFEGLVSGAYLAAFGSCVFNACNNSENVSKIVDYVQQENLAIPAVAALIGGLSLAVTSPVKCYGGIKNAIGDFKTYQEQRGMLK